ncbi:hypothetical protein B0H11DRAFT_1913569 [Mycena galericulata]|nr:hypothetical protein B0H11DRAFT_1913569 [Mycena galericulata]
MASATTHSEFNRGNRLQQWGSILDLGFSGTGSGTVVASIPAQPEQGWPYNHWRSPTENGEQVEFVFFTYRVSSPSLCGFSCLVGLGKNIWATLLSKVNGHGTYLNIQISSDEMSDSHSINSKQVGTTTTEISNQKSPFLARSSKSHFSTSQKLATVGSDSNHNNINARGKLSAFTARLPLPLLSISTPHNSGKSPESELCRIVVARPHWPTAFEPRGCKVSDSQCSKAEIGVYVKSWDSTTYLFLREFHEGKGFKAATEDVAKHLGLAPVSLSPAPFEIMKPPHFEGTLSEESENRDVDVHAEDRHPRYFHEA